MQRIFTSLFLSLITLSIFSQTTFPTNGAPVVDHSLYVLQGATVHTDPNTTRQSVDVWIRDGRIIEVSEGLAIPKGAIRRDCKGMHIYASFIDLYSNYGQPAVAPRKPSRGPQIERPNKGAFGWNEAIVPEKAAVDAFKIDEKKAEELRASGFGAVLSAQQDRIIRGTAALVSLQSENENNAVIGARVAQVMSMSRGTSSQDYPRSRMGAISLIRQSLYDEQWYSQGGAKEEYNRSLESLGENMALPQIMVCTEKNDILRADRIGDEFDFQYIFIGSGNEYERVQDVKSAGGLVVIPLNYPEALDVSDPYLSKDIPLHDLRHWEQAPSNATYLSGLGVEIAFTGNGLKNTKEFLAMLRKTVDYGLSKDEALKALTVNPAKALGMENQLGQIRSGSQANLLLCDGDLFHKGTRIIENWVQGVPYKVSSPILSDINAVYDLNLDGKRYSLTVEEKKHSQSAFLTDDSGKDTSLVKVVLTVADREVSMHFNLPSTGVFRLHGNINPRMSIWTGTGESPEGKAVAWNCIRKGDSKPMRTLHPDSNLNKVSQLRYPNNGYGWSEKPATEHLVIRNATVWTNGPKGVIEDADVVIRDGKIVGVGHNLVLADLFKREKDLPDFKTIDAYGKHVTCGIIDEHSHIAITGGVNEGGQASSAEVRIGDVIHPEDIDVYYALSGGVTAAQLLHGSSNPIGGQSALIKLRWGLNAEEMKIQGAVGFIKFALGENVKQSNWGNMHRQRFPQTRMGVEQLYYDHFIRARAYDTTRQRLLEANASKRKRKDPPLAIQRRDLELEALAEILNKERFITCHSYIQSEINMLMHVADSMRFQMNTFTHILEGYKVADKMKAHGVGASTFSDWWTYKYEVREATPYNAALMHDMGIVVAINSDNAEMGRRLNQEAAKGVKYGGMSEEEAWKMVTLNPAILLHLDQEMGSLEVGKDADVVIWSENPLSIYAKAEKTYVDGVCYYDAIRDAQLRKEIVAERARIIQKMMKAKGSMKRSASVKPKHRYHCDHEGE